LGVKRSIMGPLYLSVAFFSPATPLQDPDISDATPSCHLSIVFNQTELVTVSVLFNVL
jgi:hypothetical protein